MGFVYNRIMLCLQDVYLFRNKRCASIFKFNDVFPPVLFLSAESWEQVFILASIVAFAGFKCWQSFGTAGDHCCCCFCWYHNNSRQLASKKIFKFWYHVECSSCQYSRSTTHAMIYANLKKLPQNSSFSRKQALKCRTPTVFFCSVFNRSQKAKGCASTGYFVFVDVLGALNFNVTLRLCHRILQLKKLVGSARCRFKELQFENSRRWEIICLHSRLKLNWLTFSDSNSW